MPVWARLCSRSSRAGRDSTIEHHRPVGCKARRGSPARACHWWWRAHGTLRGGGWGPHGQHPGGQATQAAQRPGRARPARPPGPAAGPPGPPPAQAQPPSSAAPAQRGEQPQRRRLTVCCTARHKRAGARSSRAGDAPSCMARKRCIAGSAERASDMHCGTDRHLEQVGAVVGPGAQGLAAVL